MRHQHAGRDAIKLGQEMAVQQGECGMADRVVDVLEHEGSVAGQVDTQVMRELHKQRWPAEDGPRLLGHQPECGLARVMMKAPGCCDNRQQECCWVAILQPHPQPQRMPVQPDERRRQFLGEHIARWCGKECSHAGRRVLKRAADRIQIARRGY